VERWVRAVLVHGTVVLLTVALVIPISALGLAGRIDAADRLIRFWSRALIWAAGVQVEALGLEHARGLGPCVILCNHRSHLDGPVLLCTLPFPFSFVIKKSLARIPLWGWAVTRAGYIAIDRSDHRDSVAGMRRAADRVRAGRRVLTFPEGTRSRADAFLPFKKGGAVLAIEAQVPILPVALAGTFDRLPKGSRAPRPGPVVVAVGPPIPTAGLTLDDRNRLIRQAEAAIHELHANAQARLSG